VGQSGTFRTGRYESFSPRPSGSPRGPWGSSTLERKDPYTLPEIETIFVLLAAVAALATLANRIGVPYSILLDSRQPRHKAED